MAFRFQRRVKLAPGVRMNLGLGGASISLGPRGASVTAGRRGIYGNAGLPGTGLSIRQRLDRPARRVPRDLFQPSRAEHQQVPSTSLFQSVVNEDGKVTIEDEHGNALPPAAVKRIRQSFPEAVERALEQAVANINAELDACLGVHLLTPAPAFAPLPKPEGPDPQPVAPPFHKISIWDRILLRRRRLDLENARAKQFHESRLAEWHRSLDDLEALRARTAAINAGVETGRQPDMEAMLGVRLAEIVWAKETQVAFDFGDNSRTLALDLDLPTLDEMPHRTASMPSRGINLRISTRSEVQRRRDFIRLVAGSCFRVAGEAFACLPTVEEVTVSGFTQRPDSATGATRDVYLISVRIPRKGWSKIDFQALEHIEPHDALESFDLSFRPDRNGSLREIEPH